MAPKSCKNIKTLWIGRRLGVIEQLTLLSFLKCGHEVELFSYEEVEDVPSGVIIRNGNDILPEKEIFYSRKSHSVAAFSDWFRYKMLFEEGGIWVDMDVVCLKKFDFDQDVFFGLEEVGRYNNAVLGGDQGLPIFEFMANQAASPNKVLPYDSPRDKFRKIKRKYFQGNDRGNVKWGETGPVGFTKSVKHFSLRDRALPYECFYPIHPLRWDSIFDETYPSVSEHFPNTYAIHLWNEMMKTVEGFNKNDTFSRYSLIEVLKRQYLN